MAVQRGRLGVPGPAIALALGACLLGALFAVMPATASGARAGGAATAERASARAILSSCSRRHRSAVRRRACHRQVSRCRRVAGPDRRVRCLRRVARRSGLDIERPRVAWRAPRHRRTVSGTIAWSSCEAVATDNLRVARVIFSVDGRTVSRERNRPYNCNWNTTGVPDGQHRLTARAYDPAGNSAAVTIAVVVRNGRPPRVREEVTGGGRAGDWFAGYETGDFTEWTAWGQWSPDQWGHLDVIDPESEGVPRKQGSKVARFETTPDDILAGRIHAKLYKGFFTTDSEGNRRPPADVSGTYRAWYYFPETYRVPTETWVNVFQFKEKYRTADRRDPSDPLWWIEVRDAAWMLQRPHKVWHGDVPLRPNAPVAFTNYRTAPNNERTLHAKPIPLGRWVEFRAELHQGDRIDFFIDGEHFDTARHSEYPVSPFHGEDSLEWLFGTGNYSTGSNGPLYGDEASYTSR